MDDKQKLLLMREDPEQSLRLATERHASVVFSARKLGQDSYLVQELLPKADLPQGLRP